MKYGKQIEEISTRLTNLGVVHIVKDMHDGKCITVINENDESILCTIIQHSGSYGCNQDKVEMMGLHEYLPHLDGLNSEVNGWLSVNDVTDAIESYLISTKDKEVENFNMSVRNEQDKTSDYFECMNDYLDGTMNV